MKNPSEQFWQYFLEVKPALERSDSEALRSLYIHLTKVDKRLYLHTGSKDSGWDLILSAEGIPELMPVLAKLVELAPNIEGWSYIPCYDGHQLFGQRNDDVYPADINGDVLYNMASEGDQPWIPREVNFSVIFPNLDSAESFMKEFGSNDITYESNKYEEVEGFSWDITIKRKMCPTHSGITAYEERISQIAEKFGGRNDGWGCFRVEKAVSEQKD